MLNSIFKGSLRNVAPIPCHVYSTQQQQQHMLIARKSQPLGPMEPGPSHFVPLPVLMTQAAPRQPHNPSSENDIREQTLKMLRTVESKQCDDKDYLENFEKDVKQTKEDLIRLFNQVTICKETKDKEVTQIKENDKVEANVEELERAEVRKIKIENPQGIEVQLEVELERERAKKKGIIKLGKISETFRFS